MEVQLEHCVGFLQGCQRVGEWWGHLFPALLKGGQWGQRCLFITIS